MKFAIQVIENETKVYLVKADSAELAEFDYLSKGGFSAPQHTVSSFFKVTVYPVDEDFSLDSSAQTKVNERVV